MLVIAVALGLSAPASAQITWNITYSDPAGVGFNSNDLPAGEVFSYGQLRRNSVTAATDYLSTVFDGRGTVNFTLFSVFNGGPIAQFDASQLSNRNGSFENGGPYQAARTNAHPFGGQDGFGFVDFAFGYNYTGQNNGPDPGFLDLTSVAAREFVYAAGFRSNVDGSGRGRNFNTVGTPDAYTGFDRFLQRGDGQFAPKLFNTDITSAGFGSFTGDAGTLTNGNGLNDGLFFGGDFAREVANRYGANPPTAAPPLNAPATFQDRLSVSKVSDAAALMSPEVFANDPTRLQPYEIAMLLDIGWNTYLWNSTSGKWRDGAQGLLELAESRWLSERGIVFDGTNFYNSNGAPDAAPVLPPSGQVTSNIVLEFRATGSNGYTTFNDIGTVQLSRLKVNNSSVNPITIAGGTLNFGQNSDGSPAIMVPRIEQYSSGPLVIDSAIQTNTIGDRTVDGVLFRGIDRLQVGGPGTGAVTISGNITGTGGLDKVGGYTLTLTGINSYTGNTTVNGGTLLVNGDHSAATGTTTVTFTNTLGGSGTLGGPVLVQGTLAPGNSIGTLTVNGSVTLDNLLSGGTLRAELGAGGSADILNLAGGANALILESPANVALVNSGFDATTPTTFLLVDLQGTDPGLVQFPVQGGTLFLPAGNDISVFTSTGGNAGTVTKVNGDVNLTLTGFNLNVGDKLTLRREAISGDVVVVFTPVPEPGTILGACALAAGGVAAWRRWRKK